MATVIFIIEKVHLEFSQLIPDSLTQGAIFGSQILFIICIYACKLDVNDTKAAGVAVICM